MTDFKCMSCGQYHKDGSRILMRHIHQYYQNGGTIDLSRWEKRLTAAERDMQISQNLEEASA